MADDDICENCGRLASEHCHDFVPLTKRPDGCVCDAKSWGNPRDIPPVCASFAQNYEDDSDDSCLDCEHDKACHASPAEPAP